MITCAIFPVTVAITIFRGLVFLRSKLLPIYSPDLAGVKLLIAMPPKTVKNRYRSDHRWEFRSSLNFCASKFQFKNTIKKTSKGIVRGRLVHQGTVRRRSIRTPKDS